MFVRGILITGKTLFFLDLLLEFLCSQIFWVAPIAGSLLATFIYQLLFAEERARQETEQKNNNVDEDEVVDLFVSTL